jgi:hypothetical protein
MNLDQFRATRKPCVDLGAALSEEMLNGVGGLLYCDVLYIEDTTTWTKDAPGYGKGRWYTLIGRVEYQSDDLAVIEERLYDFASREGYTA